jgi:hypothetical protein
VALLKQVPDDMLTGLTGATSNDDPLAHVGNELDLMESSVLGGRW